MFMVLMVKSVRLTMIHEKCFAVMQSTSKKTAQNSMVEFRLCLKMMMSRYIFYMVNSGSSSCR